VGIQAITFTLFLVGIGLLSSPTFAQQFDELNYDIRGGEVLGFEIDSENSSLKISIDARARGELVLTLPRYLIDAKTGSEDKDFEIFVNSAKLQSYDETITPFDRTITIPIKRQVSEIIITGTHVFSQLPTTQTNQPQSIDEIIQSELREEMPEGQAKLLIFSNTAWSGALQSSNFDYTEIEGTDDDDIVFECGSSLGRQGVFGAKITKLTQEGLLQVIVIQDQRVITQGSTGEEFGEIVINGNCASDFESGPGGCLIATATYGSELAPQVQFLREIRDNTVMSTTSGAAFMTGFNQLYYSFSPTIADMERENPLFQQAVRAFITPMISTLSIMTLADEGSEMEVLELGISVITLNLGMYIAVPALIGFKVNKYFNSRKDSL